MLMIRFSRTGKKKQPYYRILISEKHKDPWGDYLELLGTYNPRTKAVELKTDRIKYWLSVGAQTSDSVYNLLAKEGVIEAKTKRKAVKISKKRQTKITEKKKAASEEAEAKAAAEKKPQEPTVEEPETETAAEAQIPETPAEKPAETEEKTEEVKEETKTEEAQA
jgi:small subunit ribosomal protein S16